MRWFLSVFVLAFGLMPALSGPVSAQSNDSQAAAIEATIGAQIEAFLADDIERAFGYASPGIQQMFRTPENFGAMVQQGYPMVWRPADVQFLDLQEIGGRLWQRVKITDAAGAVHFLGYEMIPSEDGWKINGVRPLDGESQSV